MSDKVVSEGADRNGDAVTGRGLSLRSGGVLSAGTAAGAGLPATLHDMRSAPARPDLSLAMRLPRETGAFTSLRRGARIGTIALLAFVVTTTGLMANAVISGAVMANGRMIVETGPKAVQHPVGGVVAEVLVRDDERVEAGEPVIVLDDALARAELVSIETRLAHRMARLARLVAERDGLPELARMASVEFEALGATDFAAIQMNETLQLELRERERENRREQIRERIAQAENTIRAAELQRDSNERQLALVEEELTGLRQLYERKLVPAQRVFEGERTLSDLQARRGAIEGTLLSERSRIAELELQIGQVDEALRSGITDQIADTRAEVAELKQRRVVAATALADRVLVAPQSGHLFQMSVGGPGEVVQPGQTVALVVPEDDALLSEVRLSPSDIDQVFPGQHVSIVFSAFDRGTTPQLEGRLGSISPDLYRDERSGASYYTARVLVEPSEIARMDGVDLVPGMPVEAFIKTTDRTILSYVTKPLMDQVRRALR